MSIPCTDDTPLLKYFIREDVKEASHVNQSKKWEMYSYSVYYRYYRQDKALFLAYPTLFENNIRILIYNGDTDAVVLFNEDEQWIEALNFEVLEPQRQWRAYEDKNNVAGYAIKYKELTFCTVKGAGHEVPKSKPKESFYMFSKFLKEESF